MIALARHLFTKALSSSSTGLLAIFIAAGLPVSTVVAEADNANASAAAGSDGLDASLASSAVTFIDRTSEQPFSHQYTGGWEHFVGGGVAAFDCNNDHFADLYVAGGETPAKLLINSGQQALRFTPKPSAITDLKAVTGAYPLDIDGDGILDLVVLRAGENRLLRGLGNCEFEIANEHWKYPSAQRWTTAFSATWEAPSQGPTLVFGNYVDRSRKDGPFGACDSHQLYRMHEQQFGEAIELTPGYCTLSILFSDWKHRGKADLRVSNDRHYYLHDGEEQLWKMQPKPVLYQTSEGWQSFKIWGMGIASRDITGDGLPDYLLTSMSDQKFQVLNAEANGPKYDDQAFKRGMIAHRPYFGDEGRPSTAWHAQFGDVNNDGLDDLFIAKGNVDQMPDSAVYDPNNLLLQDVDGNFHEIGQQAGIADTARSRGAALEDFNNDGLLDLVVVNRRADFRVYQNAMTAAGNWVAIRLKQAGKNRDAVGAWITVEADGKRYQREVTVGGGHAGGSLLPQHFGIGKSQQVRVQVTWPDQAKSPWYELVAGSIWQVSKGQSPKKDSKQVSKTAIPPLSH